MVPWGVNTDDALSKDDPDPVDDLIHRVDLRRSGLYSVGGESQRRTDFMGDDRVKDLQFQLSQSQRTARDIEFQSIDHIHQVQKLADDYRAEIVTLRREIDRLRHEALVNEQQAEETFQLHQDVVRYRQAAQEAAADRDDLEYQLQELRRNLKGKQVLEDDRLRFQRVLEDTIAEEKRQWERERADERLRWQQDQNERINDAVHEVSQRLQLRYQQHLEDAVSEETQRLEQQYNSQLDQVRREVDEVADMLRLITKKRLELSRLTKDAERQQQRIDDQARELDHQKQQLVTVEDEVERQMAKLLEVVAKVKDTSRDLERLTLDVASATTAMTAVIRWGLSTVDQAYNLDDIIIRIEQLVDLGLTLVPLSLQDQQVINTMNQHQLDQEYRYLVGEEIPGWGFAYDRDPSRRDRRQRLLESYVYLKAVVERLRKLMLDSLCTASAMPTTEFAQVVKLWESERFEPMTCRRMLRWGSLPLRPHQR